jgi:hypothetical protein
MSLDFVILGQNGAPEKTVPLGADLHWELMNTASALGLARFQDFADYYEDVEIAVDDLPDLGGQIQTLRAKTGSPDLQRFLEALSNLIAYATKTGKSLHVIAD